MSPVAVASTPSTATCFAMPKSIRRTVPEGSSHDVRGLQIAVNDADGVYGLQPVRDLDGDSVGALRTHGPGLALELAPLHEGSIEMKRWPPSSPVFVDAADVPVHDPARQLDLGSEPPPGVVPVRAVLVQHLQRDLFLQDRGRRPDTRRPCRRGKAFPGSRSGEAIRWPGRIASSRSPHRRRRSVRRRSGHCSWRRPGASLPGCPLY